MQSPRHELRFVELVTTRATDDGTAPDSMRDSVRDDGAVVMSAQPTLPNAASYVPRTRRWALVAVVVVSFTTAAWVAHPLWVAILLGVVMAVSAHRPYQALVTRIGENRKTWASSVMTPQVCSAATRSRMLEL